MDSAQNDVLTYETFPRSIGSAPLNKSYRAAHMQERTDPPPGEIFTFAVRSQSGWQGLVDQIAHGGSLTP